MNRKIGVVLSYILMIFEVLSTLLLTPFIIKTLGQAEYGVYKLSAAINAYLLLLDLGIGNAITRYIAKYMVTNEKENERKFFGVATIYYLFIAVVAIVCGIILITIFPKAFAKGLTHKEIILGQQLLSITMINSAVTLGTAAYNNIIIAYEKFGVSKGASIIQIIFRIILTYIALLEGMGSIGIVSVNLLMTVICRLFFVFYVLFFLKLKPLFKGIDAGFIKEIVMYSSLILLQMIATQINSSVDQVLIGALVGSSAVILAVYGVGTQIVQYFQSIGSAFTGILMPGIVKLVENNPSNPKAIMDEMVRIGRIILIVLGMIWSVFIVNGEEFICLWAGNDNRQAYLVAIILMSAYVFVLTESVGTQILWAKNEHKEQAIIKFLIVILNIFLTAVLIKWNPLIGATIGTFISLVFGDVVVMNVVFQKKLKLSIKNYYKKLFKGILPGILITVLAGVGLRKLSEGMFGWVSFALKSLFMVVIYVAYIYACGMNQYEKNLCLSMLKKNRRKRGEGTS